MAAPFALAFQEPELGFWLTQLTQWATSLFHLTNIAFRNIQDPSSLFRLYHQQDLQSQISLFPGCLISSHFPAWHTQPQAMQSQRSHDFGGCQHMNHKTHILALHLDSLHLCKPAALKTEGYLSPSGRAQMISHGSTPCTAVQLSHLIKHSKY